MNYLEWATQWFEENAAAEKEEILQHLEDNFFDLGYIDSFGFIALLGAVEETFHVSFSNEQFQDRSFSTIRGFSECLRRACDEKG